MEENENVPEMEGFKDNNEKMEEKKVSEEIRSQSPEYHISDDEMEVEEDPEYVLDHADAVSKRLTSESVTRENSPGESVTRENSPGQSLRKENSPGQSVTRENSPGQSLRRENSPGQSGTRENSPSQSGSKETLGTGESNPVLSGARERTPSHSLSRVSREGSPSQSRESSHEHSVGEEDSSGEEGKYSDGE